SGVLSIQILSLVNLGAMGTKLGQMNEAECLLVKALEWIERLRNREKLLNPGTFVESYADATIHYVQRGKDRTAAVWMKKMKPTIGYLAELDRVFTSLALCEFHLHLGQKKRVHQVLNSLNDSFMFKSDFFQVERTLIEARLGDSSKEQSIRVLE